MKYFHISVKYILFIVFAFTCRASAEVHIPANEIELDAFLGGVTSGTLNVKSLSGVYALPKNFKIFGKEDIRGIEFRDGRVILKSNAPGSRGFVLIRPLSLDKLSSSKTIGELLGSIALPEGGDYWKILESVNGISKDQKDSGAWDIPVRFCYYYNSSLFFYSAHFIGKMTDEAVSFKDKPIGPWGPLTIKVDAFQVLGPNPADFD